MSNFMFSDLLKIKEPEYVDEEEYCRSWFGSNYLGSGFVKCDYCKDVPVKMTSYYSVNCCDDCKAELN